MLGWCHRIEARRIASALFIFTAVVLAGCGSTGLNRAPVEDRGAVQSAPVAVVVEGQAPPVKQPAGFENAGKPGYYTVKPGDTLIRIGLDNGQNWRDIGRWSGVENPNQIEVGQVLRVIPPAPSPAVVVASAVAVTKPVSASSAAASPLPAQSASAPKPAAGVAAAPMAVAAATADEEISWIWPASGAVLSGFDEVKNKGLDIGGVAGEAVLAASDGRVVYVGAGLRGYGNLIILKHNNTYLTAYAHNQALLVKEDQSVKKGQKIAEMGNSDADRVKLHFEVRRQGKPVDPSKYLPPR